MIDQKEQYATLPRGPLVSDIINRVAEASGIAAHHIVGHRRDREFVTPRKAVYWLAREHTNRSLPEIGRAIGGRDHTTVIYGIEKAQILIDRGDPEFCELIARLTAPEGQDLLI